MNKVVFPLTAQRVDKPDAHAFHDLTVGEFRRVVRTMFGQKVVFSEFTAALTGPGAPKQITFTRGAAITGETVDGVAVLGELTGAGEGDAVGVLDFTGYQSGEWTVWLAFNYSLGESRNRAHLVDLTGVEGVGLTTTRDVAGWSLAATLNGTDPDQPDPWIKLLEVHIDGEDLLVGDLTDKRDLFFEGQADGATYTVPAFSRDADRSTNGSKSLRDHVLAALKRFEELGGRAWYPAPVFGENVRAASDTITVGDPTGDAARVHVEWDGPTAAEATFLLATPGVAGDEKARVHFVPTAARARPQFDFDTSATGVQAAGSHPQHISGGHFRRTAGANPLFLTVSLQGAVEDFVFDAGTVEVTELLRLASSNDEVTFRNCTFDANGNDPLGSLVKIVATGRYIFDRCTFRGGGVGCVTTGVLFTADAAATFIGCRFEDLNIGVDGGGFGDVSFVACVWNGCLTDNVKLVGPGARITFPVTDAAGDFAGSDVNGSVLASGTVSGTVLETRSRMVTFGTDRVDAINFSSSTFAPFSYEAGPAEYKVRDIAGRWVSAAKAFVWFDYSAGDSIVITSPRVQIDGNRLCFAEGADVGGKPQPGVVYPHFSQFQIGADSTDPDTTPIIDAAFFLRKTIYIKVTDAGDGLAATPPAVFTTVRGVGVAVVNFVALDQNSHSFVVSGLGLLDANYRVFASIATDIDPDVMTTSSDYVWGAQVLDVDADGFTVVPKGGGNDGHNGHPQGSLFWGAGPPGITRYYLSILIEWAGP